ncbi:MAG: acylphosphatase [Chitinophagaceae bacterium]
MATLRLIIQGKVQGVFYRVSARKTARQIGITGWVKNTPERHVEILASGTIEQLQNFVEWCKKGPSDARVEKVNTEDAAEQHFDEFKILH